MQAFMYNPCSSDKYSDEKILVIYIHKKYCFLIGNRKNSFGFCLNILEQISS